MQNKDGTGYVNVGANGNRWGGQGKAPKIPETNKNLTKTTFETTTTVAIIVIELVIACIAAPITGGVSFVIILTPEGEQNAGEEPDSVSHHCGGETI